MNSDFSLQEILDGLAKSETSLGLFQVVYACFEAQHKAHNREVNTRHGRLQRDYRLVMDDLLKDCVLKMCRYTSDGHRWRLETVSVGEESRRTYHSVCWDGREETQFVSGGEFPTFGYKEKRDNSESGAWDINWSGRLSQTLRESNSVLLRREQFRGLETYVVKAEQLPLHKGDAPVAHTVWLAPEKSFREVRKENLHHFDEEVPDRFSFNCYETSEWMEFAGQWLPKRGASLNGLGNENGVVLWRRFKWFEVAQINHLPGDERSLFSLELPFGCPVNVREGGKLSEHDEGCQIKPYQERLKRIREKRRLPRDVGAFARRVITG